MIRTTVLAGSLFLFSLGLVFAATAEEQSSASAHSTGLQSGSADSFQLAATQRRLFRRNREHVHPPHLNSHHAPSSATPMVPSLDDVRQELQPSDNLTLDAAPDAAISGTTKVTSTELDVTRANVRQCLDYYFEQRENASSRSPWGIMHSLIAYGVDTQIVSQGRNVNAIGWLCWNQPCRGQRLFYTSNGQLGLREGPGVQGHSGQFLAMLAQSKVRADYSIRINGQDFTVADVVRYEQAGCRAGTELTFKLIGLAHYLDSDAEWTNNRGEKWTISRLIQEELKQSINGSACGGTHRMMGFSYAVRKREQRGEPMTGQWARAKKFVDDYHEYTFKLQNPDGSFSTNWFRGSGNSTSRTRRLETSGHTLEWLAFSLPEHQLQDERVVKAVNHLTTLLWEHRQSGFEVGPKGHALHALVLYDQRVFGSKAGQRNLKLAQQPDDEERH